MAYYIYSIYISCFHFKAFKDMDNIHVTFIQQFPCSPLAHNAHYPLCPSVGCYFFYLLPLLLVHHTGVCQWGLCTLLFLLGTSHWLVIGILVQCFWAIPVVLFLLLSKCLPYLTGFWAWQWRDHGDIFWAVDWCRTPSFTSIFGPFLWGSS